jgi:hypothetical protein
MVINNNIIIDFKIIFIIIKNKVIIKYSDFIVLVRFTFIIIFAVLKIVYIIPFIFDFINKFNLKENFDLNIKNKNFKKTSHYYYKYFNGNYY